MKKELWYYVSVSAGLSLSTSSFLIISGMFEVSNFINVALGCLFACAFCMIIASGIGELASIFPSSPGIRTYLRQALGDKISLLFTYMYMTVLVLIAGAESHVFAKVVKAVFPFLNEIFVIICVLLFVIIINIRGLELPKVAQILMTYILLIGIFAIGIYGIIIYLTQPSPTIPNQISISLVDASILPSLIGLAFFLFIGFEWVTPLGETPNAYKKDIPFSMIIALGMNTLIYIIFVGGIGLTMTSSEISSTSIPQVKYLDILFTTPGKYIAGFLSLLAILSTFNAGLLGGSRFVYALAREGKMPAFCTKVSSHNGTPINAIYVLGACSVFSALIVNIFKMDLVFAIVSSVLICWIYSALVVSVPLLRIKLAHKKRPFTSAIPLPVFWVLGIVLLLLGVASIFTIQTLAITCTIFLSACMAIIFSIVWGNSISKKTMLNQKEI